MGRPTKQGLEYFSLDVRLFSDIKIRKLIKYHKAQAVSVYLILLCRIYEKGYYIVYDKDLPFIISEDCGLEEDTVIDIIRYCIDVELFDKTVFERDKVLTSHGIQERYIQACAKTKRKLSGCLPYLLLDLCPGSVVSDKRDISFEETLFNSEETELNTAEITENAEKSTQRKEKESKEDIDSSLRSESSSSPCPTTDNDGEINFSGVMAFFNAMMEKHHAVIATITDMTKKRRDSVAARIRSYGIESLKKVIVNAATSDFLNGENDKSWVADFNWLFKPNNYVKVLEGNYNHQFSQHNIPSYGARSHNGYRSRQDIDEGTFRTLARMSAAAEQPARELPVV